MKTKTEVIHMPTPRDIIIRAANSYQVLLDALTMIKNSTDIAAHVHRDIAKDALAQAKAVS